VSFVPPPPLFGATRDVDVLRSELSRRVYGAHCAIVIPQAIEGLDSLVHLENLWLGKNKITRIQVRGAAIASEGHS
jgi:hypothetical protein